MKHLLWIPVILIAFIIGCKKDEKTSTATITTTTPTNITANGATSGGDITNNGGSAISKSGVCFAMHNNPSLSDSITSDGATTGSFSSSLTNLNANVTYYVRAYAINASGTAFGNTDSFTTSKGAPTISTTTISNNQALSVNTGWTLLNNGGAAITALGICWSTSPHPTISNSKNSDTITKTMSVDTLSNLIENVTYYVRAYATNSFGTAYGNELSFTVSSTNTVTDFDGNVYPTVAVGNQTWMSVNLKVTHYQNGDSIINGLADNFDWYGTILTSSYIGAYTFPNGDTTKKQAYGLLYNNYAVNDSRNICPTGWHTPSQSEWSLLEYNEGMDASDTGTVQGPVGTIAPKLLSGGQSGLNLQLGGWLNISGPGNYQYKGLDLWGYYLTSSNANIGRIANTYFGINTTTGTPDAIDEERDFSHVLAVRCVKN